MDAIGEFSAEEFHELIYILEEPIWLRAEEEHRLERPLQQSKWKVLQWKWWEEVKWAM